MFRFIGSEFISDLVLPIRCHSIVISMEIDKYIAFYDGITKMS